MHTQVIVDEHHGSRSVSEQRHIRLTPTLLRKQAATKSHSAAGLALGINLGGTASTPETQAGLPSLPLDLSVVEIVILQMDWPKFGVYAFHLQWLILVVVLLLIPR